MESQSRSPRCVCIAHRTKIQERSVEYMNRSRRDFLRRAFTATALLGAGHIASAQSTEHKHQGQEAPGEGRTEAAPPSGRSDGTAFLSVETPDIPKDRKSTRLNSSHTVISYA